MTDSVVLAWSGGKDSLMALAALEAEGCEIAALLTTLSEPRRRISMHGVRESLLETQAAALDLPLAKVWLPENADNEVYRERFAAALAPLAAAGAAGAAFGDLHLADVRAFRAAQMRALGLTAFFPLWGTAPGELAARFVASDARAIVVCVDARQLNPAFLGRDYDADFLVALPPGVDPCGENGEFHSFVYAGPRFARTLVFRRGRRVVRAGRFHFLDLLAGTDSDIAV